MSIYRCATVWGLAVTSAVFSARADWSISNVETGADVGFAVSLAIDTAGFPHVSYLRPSNSMGFSALTYATRTGDTWVTEPIVTDITNGTQGSTTSIAVTELGNPVVSFTRSSTFVRYSIRSAGAWTMPIEVSNTGGGYTSLVWQGTEAAPTPRVAFNDSAANDLRFAVMSAGTFTSQALDTDIDAGAFCSMAQIGDYVAVAFIDGNKLGMSSSPNGGMNWGVAPGTGNAPFSTLTVGATICAMALAPSASNTDPVSAHILFFDNTTSRYKYITNDTDTGTWTVPELVFQSGLVTITQYGCSIVVDSAGVIHAAFLDYNTKRLGYSKRTASGWSAAEFPEGAAIGGAFCNIRIGANGQPAIAYASMDAGMSYATNAVKFAEFSNSPVTPTGTPSLVIPGKSKRTTTKSKLKITGSASNAVTVQWKVGKKSFKKVAVSGGKWTAKVGPLVAGKNKVKFQAISSAGAASSIKSLSITRTE